jgi:hypothetical protein
MTTHDSNLDLPRPPARLKLARPGRALWRVYCELYDFDAVQLDMLGRLCQAADRAAAAAELLAAEGLLRNGKAHPAVKLVHDTTVLIMALARNLGVALEPLRAGPGRPTDAERRRA